MEYGWIVASGVLGLLIGSFRQLRTIVSKPAHPEMLAVPRHHVLHAFFSFKDFGPVSQ